MALTIPWSTAVVLAVRAHVRRRETGYDAHLANGIDRHATTTIRHVRPHAEELGERCDASEGRIDLRRDGL
jgi:hypothetical protein